MAKQRTSVGKGPVKSLQEKSKILSNNAPWNNMTNWLIVLIIILPVLFTRVTIDINITVRYTFLGVFIFLFILFFFVLRRSSINFYFPRPAKTVFIMGAGYGCWAILSMFFATNIQEAYYEIARHFLNMVLLFVVMITIRQEESQVLKLCKALMIASLIQSLVGILQNYELAFMDITGGAAPNGLMGNRNLFGSAQVLLLPFILFVLYRGGKAWRYTGIVALTGIVVSVIISQTRSAWLASMVMGITSFTLIFFFSRANRKRWIIGTLSGMLGIVTLACLILITKKENHFTRPVQENTFTEFFNNRTSATQSALDNDKSSGRFSLWSKSLQLLKDHPSIGVGPGNWKLVIPLYGSEGTREADGLLVPSWPHNVYLQVACETGVPGVLLYFSMWILITIIGFKIILISQSEDFRVITILILSGLAAFAADSMFSFPTERMEHSLYLILMGGIILGCYSNLLKTKNVAGPGQIKMEKSKFSVRAKTRSGLNKSLLVCVLSIALFNLFLGYKKYNFEKHMNLVKTYREQNLNLEALSEVEAGKTMFVTIDPNSEPLEIHSAAVYEKLKDFDKALEEIKTARRYHPNSARILTTTGVIYTNLKRYDTAINCYRQVLKLVPQYRIAIKNLAGVYFITGNYAACIQTLGRVNIENNEYLLNLLNEAKKRQEEQ